MSTSTKNKRHVDEEQQQQQDLASSTKRQRRCTVEDPEQLQLAEVASRDNTDNAATVARQLVADLERQQKVSEDRLTLLKRQQSEEQRRCDRLALQLAAAKEQLAKAESHRRRRATHNPRIEQGLSMYKTGTVKLDELLYEQFSDLVDNGDFWWAFFDEKLPLDAKVFEILWDKEPPTVLNNKELMLELCKYDPSIYHAIPGGWELDNDQQLVQVVLALDPNSVTGLLPHTQRQYPRHIGKALARLPLCQKNYKKSVFDYIDSSLWSNRDVVLGWVKGGGELFDAMPKSIRKDPEIILTAMGNREPTNLQEPDIPSPLRGNFEFMKQAVEKNPFALSMVAEHLKSNVDLAITALSGTHGILAAICDLSKFIPDDGKTKYIHRDHRFWIQVGESILQQLHLNETFVKLVIGSIRFSDTKPSDLAVLNQGEDTSTTYMELIADFAGVPIGKELGKLHRARKALANAGVRWSD